ncbi:Clp protease N-terminal domain-containing protein [Actinosynnema sp. NPDC050801]|uniref:Clp protease N-terminal domain-containing protein n=1 Tax=unclassified Actinosynnema TaxID=2637065 RepID=UPI0034021987
MPKINVYLPDDLSEQVKEAGVPVSAVCQRALEQAVRRIGTIRAIRLDEPATQDAAARQSRFTDRLRTVLRLAADRARADGSATVGTGHLLGGVLEEGANLALRVLRAMDVDPERVRLPERSGDAAPTAYGTTAAAALELAVTEALTLGHDYVGCEHLLIGLVAEPDGSAGRVLRGLGVDPRGARQAVVAALSGLAHLQAATAARPDQTAAITAVVRRELQPLVERIERLESA